MTAKCFSEDEKRLMVERVRANETGIQNKVYKRYQAVEALADPIVWLYVMLQLTSTIVIGGLGFGFTYLETQLLNIAQGAVTIFVIVGSAALCTWTNQTAWVMHAWAIPPIIGTAIVYHIEPTASTRVGQHDFSLISRNIAGQTKKSTALAMTFIAWAAGNMTAPQIFQSTDAPRYHKGFAAHFCLYVLFNIALAVTRVILTRRNHKKRSLALESSEAAPVGVAAADVAGSEKIGHSNAFKDLTDSENPDFRYNF